jgi:hypothetical protein
MRKWILAIFFLLAGCVDDGTSIDHACKKDSDCPRPEMTCVVAAGVCTGFNLPLHGDGGLQDVASADQ